MPNKKDQDNIDPQDLEKKVDAMMSAAPEEQAATKPIVPEAAAPQVDTKPGVPEVPKKLQKGLDAFSTDTPDITVEPDTPAAEAEQATAAPLIDPTMTVAQTDIDSPATDEAVTDIVRGEADTLLAVDDADSEEAPAVASGAKWWRSKRFIYTVVILVILAAVALIAVPKTRYMLLNVAGVRSQASVKVVDERTSLPLKNVTVKIGVAQAKTDTQGVARFDTVRLGSQEFVVERVAFAPIQKNIVVGWGSNPLGEVKLRATGVRYELKITDFTSGKPVKAEATSGESVATADSKGVANVVVEDVSQPVVEILVQANGYRTEKVLIDASKKEVTNVVLAPSKPIVYVTKQTGRYDAYRIDVDGKNKQLVLAGTGRESQDMRVALSPDGLTAAIVSSRGTKRDARGTLLDTLTLVTLKTNTTKVVDEAQDITLEDWVGTRLVYTATYPKDDTNTEQRLVAYDVDESARTGLATANYFSTVASIGGYIYYANIESDQTAAMAYQKIRPDGSGKQSILEARVLSATRTGYDAISLETADGWFAYTVGDATAAKGAAPPDSYITRQYAASPDGAHSAWVDNRDGKGVLVLHDLSSHKDTTLVTASGLAVPVRWLNNTTIAYRVTNINETAEYIKSTTGGTAKKVVDVTNVGGLRFNF